MPRRMRNRRSLTAEPEQRRLPARGWRRSPSVRRRRVGKGIGASLIVAVGQGRPPFDRRRSGRHRREPRWRSPTAGWGRPANSVERRVRGSVAFAVRAFRARDRPARARPSAGRRTPYLGPASRPAHGDVLSVPALCPPGGKYQRPFRRYAKARCHVFRRQPERSGGVRARRGGPARNCPLDECRPIGCRLGALLDHRSISVD